MLDHVGFTVSDYERSKAFYAQTLAPLGISLLLEPIAEAAGFGSGGKPYFWVETRGEPVSGRLHVAFATDHRADVDGFHAAGLAAGGTDNGGPGIRAIYHPNYYAAYVLDPTATTSRPSATGPNKFGVAHRLRDRARRAESRTHAPTRARPADPCLAARRG